MFLGTKPEESSSQDKPTSCNTVKTEINGSTNHEFNNGEYSNKLALIVEINVFFFLLLINITEGEEWSDHCISFSWPVACENVAQQGCHFRTWKDHIFFS
jgi:hypothetical protein